MVGVKGLGRHWPAIDDSKLQTSETGDEGEDE